MGRLLFCTPGLSGAMERTVTARKNAILGVRIAGILCIAIGLLTRFVV